MTKPATKSRPRPRKPDRASASLPAACSIISRNYLPQARVLAQSYLEHHPNANFYLLVVDKLPAGVDAGPGIKLIEPEQLKLAGFADMAFKYDVTELSTAVKPTLMALLMQQYGEQQLCYFDPDILITRPLTELHTLMAKSSLVLIPHLLSPIPLDGKRPAETDILMSGAYNLGFLGLRDSKQTRDFLLWWEQRLRDHCLVDTARGLMTDQKWIDLIPGLFLDTKILANPAYNVAYWNIHSRPITKKGDAFFSAGKPLAFFHFSGFSPERPRSLSKHQNRTPVPENSPLADLLDLYAHLLMENGQTETRAWGYGFDRFDNGIRIHPLLRKLYLDLDPAARAAFGDPFRTSAPESFLRWATAPMGEGELSPFLRALYLDRTDLITEFPDRKGEDRDNFVYWAQHTGPGEEGYDPRLAGLDKSQPAISLPKSAAGLNVCGYLGNESGLGAAARGYIRALQHAAIPIAIKDVSHTSVSRSEHPDRPVDDADHPHPINLICINPEQQFKVLKEIGEGFLKDRYNIAVWAWELPRFPERWKECFAYYNEIWAGTTFVADAIARSSPIPVVKIPPVLSAQSHGSRDAGRRFIQADPGDFVFVFAFDFHSYIERKNPLALINAFKTALAKGKLRKGKPAKLIIKCVNGDFRPDKLAEMIDHARGFPITIANGYWTDQQMLDLTQAADCYVSLHRSEGTGLTIADAMANGKPVIATGWSGNMDFMNPFNSFPVNYRLVELTTNIGPYRAGELWAEPSIEHAAQLMYEVYTNPDTALQRGQAAQAEINTRYSPAAVARQIQDRLAVIHGLTEFKTVREALATGEKPHKHIAYAQLVVQLRELIAQTIPAGSSVAVINRGDTELLKVDSVTASHFPQNEQGQYAGYHPADDAAAIAHLELRRQQGVQFFVLPASESWWLQTYAGFARHLEKYYRCVVKNDLCYIFDLRTSQASPAIAEAAAQPPASDATIRSLEERLFDIQESLRSYAVTTGEQIQRMETRLIGADHQIQSQAATLAAQEIANAQQNARLNELATLIEAHASQLADVASFTAGHRAHVLKLEASNNQISELATKVASLSRQLAERSAPAEDTFGTVKLFSPALPEAMKPVDPNSEPAVD